MKKPQEIKKRARGEVRGMVINSDLDYILRVKGERGIKEIETEMKKWGCDLALDEIKPLKLYSNYIRTVFLLSVQEVLSFSDEEMKDMGRAVAKNSSILRLLLRSFLLDEKKFFQKAPPFWKKFVTIGEVTTIDLNEEERKLTLRLDDFDIDPVFCPYIEGIFSGFVKTATKAENVSCKETKCTFKGDDHHEFLIRWQ